MRSVRLFQSGATLSLLENFDRELNETHYFISGSQTDLIPHYFALIEVSGSESSNAFYYAPEI